jgi:kynurenine formamidase
MYNGFGRDQITTKGAAKNSIMALKDGIFTRGILFDIPWLKGLPYLEPGAPIYPKDLEQWERKAGVKVSAGDVIFIRTGRWALQMRTGPWNVGKKSAGLYASCLPWIRQRDLAMIGSDAATDLNPSGVEGAGQPIHEVALAAFGMQIFDNCDLEELSQTAARYNRWEFLLTAAPLRVVGGTGSPLNPIATY